MSQTVAERSAPADRPVEPDNWVPVERRFLGLDKRTILPALGILALVVIFAGVLPAINEGVSYNREAKAGDVIDLGAGVTFVPADGWGITKGSLSTDKTRSGSKSAIALLVNGAVTFTVQQAPFEGTPNQLLTVINRTTASLRDNQGFHVSGNRRTITTNQGEQGVAEAYTGTDTGGILAAFVFGGTGVKVTAVGPPGAVENQVDDVAAMIGSINYERQGAS
jgi:hypothetical protein